MRATANAHPQEILDFWFSQRVRPLWFRSTLDLDQEIADRFLPAYRKALSGELGPWEATLEGALALVVALDQFPLNMFRGRPQSFDGEAAARAVAGRAIAQGFDGRLTPEQRAFLYLPYMHSESEVDQDRCVELCQGAGLEETLRYALHHREIIRRFGRFPHRNAVLGRESTPGERAYLVSPEAFHG